MTMEHGEIVRAIEAAIEKAQREMVGVLHAKMLVERAAIPEEDRERAVEIAGNVLRRTFSGPTDQQREWRYDEIIRHAETLPPEQAEAYVFAEMEKLMQEIEKRQRKVENMKLQMELLKPYFITASTTVEEAYAALKARIDSGDEAERERFEQLKRRGLNTLDLEGFVRNGFQFAR
jgi:hypothetical protein